MPIEDAWFPRKWTLQQYARSHFDASIRLYTKDNWFCTVLAWLLYIVTIGAMSRTRFLKDFATTIGPLQFYPAAWSTERVERVLVHEGRHVQQARWFSLGIHPWVGLPIFAFLYLCVPLPLGVAFFRALFERDALRFELQYWYRQQRLTKLQSYTRANQFGQTVCSSAYGWALPRCWGIPWFEKVARDVVQ